MLSHDPFLDPPAWRAAASTASGSQYYFAVLAPPPGSSRDANTASTSLGISSSALALVNSAPVSTGEPDLSGGFLAPRRQGSSPGFLADVRVQQAPHPFGPEVKLGQLIGRGPHGRVFRCVGRVGRVGVRVWGRTRTASSP